MATQLHSSTRQQLDELDALLQKMLDQPGKPSDSTARPIYSIDTPDAPAAAFPSPTTVAFGVPPAVAFAAETASPKTVSTNWNIDLNPRGSSSVLGERSPLAEKLAPFIEAGAAPPSFLQVTPIQNPIGDLTNHKSTPARRSADPRSSYGGLTAIPMVRDLLGYSGLAMLAASITWAALIWAGWF